ncbi:hypothetical protein AMTRI_Chr04g180020 [Amborella trichopoda]
MVKINNPQCYFLGRRSTTNSSFVALDTTICVIMNLMIYCHDIVDFHQNLIFSGILLPSITLSKYVVGHTKSYSTPDHSPTLNSPRICQRSRISHIRKPNFLRNSHSLA